MCATSQKMTPEEMLEDLKNCIGPCGRMCLSCPESRYVAEIYEVLDGLIQENKRLKEEINGGNGI